MAAFKEGYQPSKEEHENRLWQLNRENVTYWASRGEESPKQDKKGSKQ